MVYCFTVFYPCFTHTGPITPGFPRLPCPRQGRPWRCSNMLRPPARRPWHARAATTSMPGRSLSQVVHRSFGTWVNTGGVRLLWYFGDENKTNQMMVVVVLLLLLLLLLVLLVLLLLFLVLTMVVVVVLVFGTGTGTPIIIIIIIGAVVLTIVYYTYSRL